MILYSGENQSLIFRIETRVVQFERTQYQQLSLGKRKGRELFKNRRKTHGPTLTSK